MAFAVSTPVPPVPAVDVVARAAVVGSSSLNRGASPAPAASSGALFCTNCNRPNHDVSTCYRLIGFPPGWSSRGRGGGRGRGRNNPSAGRGNSPQLGTVSGVPTQPSAAAHNVLLPSGGDGVGSAVTGLNADQWNKLLSLLNSAKSPSGSSLSGIFLIFLLLAAACFFSPADHDQHRLSTPVPPVPAVDVVARAAVVGSSSLNRGASPAPAASSGALFCTNCNRPNHDVSTCYRLIGFPPGWSSRGRGGGRGRGRNNPSAGRGNSPQLGTVSGVPTQPSAAAHNVLLPSGGDGVGSAVTGLNADQWNKLLSLLNSAKSPSGSSLSVSTPVPPVPAVDVVARAAVVGSSSLNRGASPAPAASSGALFCTNCNRPNHDVSTCYRLIGFPPGWSSRGRGGGRGRGRNNPSAGRGNSPQLGTVSGVPTQPSAAAHNVLLPSGGDGVGSAVTGLNADQWNKLLSLLNSAKSPSGSSLSVVLLPASTMGSGCYLNAGDRSSKCLEQADCCKTTTSPDTVCDFDGYCSVPRGGHCDSQSQCGRVGMHASYRAKRVLRVSGRKVDGEYRESKFESSRRRNWIFWWWRLMVRHQRESI
ncbi:OLC1v1019675C1 [Oldenlandia corymbosa var. corymbosa]|uniref:OLC1v1019675C1 n=1 Tax=Oldenlandia corymbosa var. corymbosa TaxID=529605 RepID=A0AAV1EEQ6_OLDCO|nr:OLC1v1019675C1 [Oldenlandia corymbosa var. corymbosa]